MSLLIIITLYFVTSILLKNSIGFFTNSSLLDYPTDRSNHDVPKPKCAGLILIPLLIIATLLVFFLEKIYNTTWLIIFGFCLILCALSFLDDLKSINSKIRLVFQFFCVASSVLMINENILNELQLEKLEFLYVYQLSLYEIMFFFFAVILWVWITNLFNFMDGMDGISVVQVSFFSLCTNFLAILGLIEINFLYFSLILLSISIAFYSVNKPPAKIFLGDVGSIPFGFLIGFIIIYHMIKSELIIPFLIIIMYYLLDSSLTLFGRMLKKENIFEAHSNHFYQKLIRKGYSHKYVLAKIIILNSILLFISMLSLILPIFSLLSSITITMIFLYFFDSKEKQ